MPKPLNLANYIKYRVEIEHSDGFPIDERFVEMAVDRTRKVYGA